MSSALTFADADDADRAALIEAAQALEFPFAITRDSVVVIVQGPHHVDAFADELRYRISLQEWRALAERYAGRSYRPDVPGLRRPHP